MKRLLAAVGVLSIVVAFSHLFAPRLVSPPTSRGVATAKGSGKLPLSFEPNLGQADPRIQFLSHGKGFALSLTSTELALSLTAPLSAHTSGPPEAVLGSDPLPAAISMAFQGANPRPRLQAAAPLAGVSNYFLGRDPSLWRTNVPRYGRVTYRGLYPGIDLSVYGSQSGSLEYDLWIAPGADPSVVRFALRGPEAMSIDGHGNLILRAGGRDIIQSRPGIYQEAGGSRLAINGGYVLDGNRLGFVVGSYDKARPLVIDPEIVYSTYLGGSGEDFGEIHPSVDESGHAFICGATASTDFPVTPGALQPMLSEGDDGFVTEMNADGSEVVFSTYLGGTGSFDDIQDCKVDSSGNIYIGGLTDSPDLPVTPGAVQHDYHGGDGSFFGPLFDGFVGKLAPGGSSLIFMTYLGGGGDENLNNVQFDASGNVFVAGDTWSMDFPTTPGAYQTSIADGHGVECPGVHGPKVCNDEFVAKIDATGSSLLYSTYLGGKGAECCQPGLAVDQLGDAYIVGNTSSHNFPTTSEALQTHFAGGIQDAFVTKLNPTGSGLIYSTYLGGSFLEIAGIGMAVDASGNAYVDGMTCSKNFPVTPGAFQTTYAGPHGGVFGVKWCGGDIFVSKLDSSGSALVYSTYLGGSAGEGVAGGPIVDPAGHAYIVGGTDSMDFPLRDAFQMENQGAGDVTVSELTPDGSDIVFSSYLGGSGTDAVDGAALDPVGNLYLTGRTFSTDFPTTPGAFQVVPGGCPLDAFSCDAFVTKIALAN